MWCVWEVAALPRTLAVCSQAEHTSPGWDVYTYVLGTLLCVSGRPLCVSGRPLCVSGRPLCVSGRPLCVSGRPLCVSGRHNALCVR